MATVIKEVAKSEFDTISGIRTLEHEMTRILERRLSDIMVHTLKDVYRHLSYIYKHERYADDKNKEKTDVVALKKVYTNIVGAFEELEKTECGPLSYVEYRGMDRIEKLYGVAQSTKGIVFDTNMVQNFNISANMMIQTGVLPVVLLNTERNRDLAREVVGAIISSLKTKEKVLETIDFPI